MADPQGSAATPSPGLFNSVRSFWSVILAVFYTRLDLATAELEDQAARAIKVLVVGIVALLAAATAFFFANLWIIAAFWSGPYRLWAVGGVFAVYFILALVAVLYVVNAIKHRPKLLEQTIAELRRDVEGINRLVAQEAKEKK
jgi:uncharacterized membrane protein YqjE